MNENYEILKGIIGIDLSVAIPIFQKYIDFTPRGYNKETGGFPEELVAFLLNMRRPTNIKGADFKDIGEIKSVKSRINNEKTKTKQDVVVFLSELGVNIENSKTKLRNCGNPPISNFEKDKTFFETNIYDKIKKIIFIYHLDNVIIDIRIFDGKKFKNILNDDYELIKNGKNSETKIITLKEATGSIQIKKYMDIFLSDSIIESGFSNNIQSQEDYINELFLNKLINYKDDTSPKEKILLRITNYIQSKTIDQINDLKESIDKIFETTKENYNIKNVEDDLEF